MVELALGPGSHWSQFLLVEAPMGGGAFRGCRHHHSRQRRPHPHNTQSMGGGQKVDADLHLDVYVHFAANVNVCPC